MELFSTTAVMDALGGTKHVAQLTGRTYAAAFNWRSQKNFPANTFNVLQSALGAQGLAAPATLWRMTEPAEQAAQ